MARPRPSGRNTCALYFFCLLGGGDLDLSLAVTVSKSAVHVRFFFLAFGALGSKPQRAQKGGFCAAALEEVASLGVCRGSLNFHFLSLRVLQFWSYIYACWRSRFRNPRCTCDYFSWLLVLWGVSHSARKKAGFVRPHWRGLRVWGFAAGRLISIFCRCVYCNFGLIYTPVGGHGFEIRGARAIIFLGFWCFGE